MNEGLVVLVRGIIGFFTLLIFTRILGKQQVSQLTLFEYILGITIGSTASTLTTDLGTTAWSHWVGLLVWTLLVFIMQILTSKFPKVNKYINGQPEVIIANGKIMEKSMKKLRYTMYDLMEELRVNNVFDIGQVEYAILETNGKLTVLKKSQYQNLTPHDMKIDTEYSGLNTELIFNGIVIKHNLGKVNLDENWLMNELKKRQIKWPSEVYLATIDTSGNLYIDLFDDHIQKQESIT